MRLGLREKEFIILEIGYVSYWYCIDCLGISLVESGYRKVCKNKVAVSGMVLQSTRLLFLKML